MAVAPPLHLPLHLLLYLPLLYLPLLYLPLLYLPLLYLPLLYLPLLYLPLPQPLPPLLRSSLTRLTTRPRCT
jgi:hypothetical protein